MTHTDRIPDCTSWEEFEVPAWCRGEPHLNLATVGVHATAATLSYLRRAKLSLETQKDKHNQQQEKYFQSLLLVKQLKQVPSS